MTYEKAAALLDKVDVLDDPEMKEPHRVAVEVLRWQADRGLKWKEVQENGDLAKLESISKIVKNGGHIPLDKELLALSLRVVKASLQRHQRMTTNADRIRTMDIEQLADFLCELAYNDENPWYRPFYEKFCHNCPAPEYTLEDGQKVNLHECDFIDAKCPHGSDVVWWLQQPADDKNNDKGAKQNEPERKN